MWCTRASHAAQRPAPGRAMGTTSSDFCVKRADFFGAVRVCTPPHHAMAYLMIFSMVGRRNGYFQFSCSLIVRERSTRQQTTLGLPHTQHERRSMRRIIERDCDGAEA